MPALDRPPMAVTVAPSHDGATLPSIDPRPAASGQEQEMELANALKAEFIRHGCKTDDVTWQALASVAQCHFDATHAEETAARAKEKADAKWMADARARRAFEDEMNYGYGR